jgi:hypothetical protein
MDEITSNVNLTATDNTGPGLDSAMRRIAEATKSAGNAVTGNLTNEVKKTSAAFEEAGKQAHLNLGERVVEAFTKANKASDAFLGGLLGGVAGAVFEKAAEKVIEYGKEAVMTFAKMQDAMLRVQNQTGATDHQLEELQETFEGLSRATGLAATQLAQNFTDLHIKLGTSIKQSEEVFKAVTEQAHVTGSSVGETANAVAVAVRQMQVPLEEVPKMLDGWAKILPGIQNDFDTFLGRLGEDFAGFGFKGKQTVDDLAGIFRAYSTALGGNTRRATQEIEHLWTEMVEHNQLNMKKFAEDAAANGESIWSVFKEVDKRIDDMANRVGTSREAILKNLFPTDLRMQNTLQTFHKNIELIEELESKAEHADGTVAKMQERLEKDSLQQLKALWADFEKMSDKFGEMLDKLGASKVIKEFDEDVKMLIKGLELINKFLGSNEVDTLNRLVDTIFTHKMPETIPYTPQSRREAPAAAEGEGGHGVSPLRTKTPTWFQNLPKHAKGGIVTSPEIALIGEAGPEKITPLGEDQNQQDNTTALKRLTRTLEEMLEKRGQAYTPGFGETPFDAQNPPMGAGYGYGGFRPGIGAGGWGPGSGRGGGGGYGGRGRGRGGGRGGGGDGKTDVTTPSGTPQFNVLPGAPDVMPSHVPSSGVLPGVDQGGFGGGTGGTGAGGGAGGAGGGRGGGGRGTSPLGTYGGGADIKMAGGKVTPESLFGHLVEGFRNSKLAGVVPKDGARFGITTGSPEEWARFGLAVAKQESGLNPRSQNLTDPGGSFGLFQFNQSQFGLHGNAFDPTASADAFVRSAEKLASGPGGIGAGTKGGMGSIFGSIQRPGETTQHLPWASGIASAQAGLGGGGDVGPGGMKAATGLPPEAFIMHHTSGGGNIAGVQATLRQRGLGVEYAMDRQGNIQQIGGPGAAHMMKGWGPIGSGLSNRNTVGMEVIAKDDRDVTPAQVAAAQAFIAKNYPNTPVYGHGQVNPGHKEATEGMSIVNAINRSRAARRDSGRAPEETGEVEGASHLQRNLRDFRAAKKEMEHPIRPKVEMGQHDFRTPMRSHGRKQNRRWERQAQDNHDRWNSAANIGIA